MNDNDTLNQALLAFIKSSPTVFHAVDTMKTLLAGAGYSPLEESRPWQLHPGHGYYVTRNASALIAFRIPEGPYTGFQIVASHGDSPAFKIKDHPEIDVEGHYTKLNVEGYGGMLRAPWLDRPLSAAGRVVLLRQGQIQTRLVDLDQDLFLIPNLAIHMNRKANAGHEYNLQKDMLPLMGDGAAKGRLSELVAGAAGVAPADIAATELFLYNRDPGRIWGANQDFISTPRLDNLQCAFASLRGFLDAEAPQNVAVHCVFDNEEVGSGTKQGAGSTFLKDTLARIADATGATREEAFQAVAGSFMVSADNAHAVHPNFPEKTDDTNRAYLNGGVVLKHSANQKYTTDAVSAGIFKAVCQKAGVPVQSFVNRSDMPGGSTLGNIASTHTPMNTVDVGLAQLAMHSPYETGGAKDTKSLVTALKCFYETRLRCEGDGQYVVE
ncbi:M18 family aminopeptidase [Eubacterium sp. 1001713B170207_170306_E7]|uniref:M18 family aminopeptidase n=1 Tax=Eubacterium sp. 1001713B170207_170306_E7 TaxID=2787097 RepID=UPI001897880A|nr:M18 family aminopeptidase [Eubacterium sp. 1001713B170207_170306_E7]